MSKAIKSALRSEIRKDFVPASYFTGQDVADLEKRHLWPKIWHIACRERIIPNVGDFVNYEIYDESVLVVRTKKDEIKAFYNVCQHRGRRLRDDDSGNVAQGFYCKFHGWRYALDGTVVYVHDKNDWKKCENFNESNLGMKQVLIGTWAGWVWINMDPKAEPLVKWLGAVVGQVKNFDIDRCVLHGMRPSLRP